MATPEKEPDITDELKDKPSEQSIIEVLNNKIDLLEQDMKDVKNAIKEKDKDITLLTKATIDMLNIESLELASEVNDAIENLMKINTIEQAKAIREITKNRGLQMTVDAEAIYRSEAGVHAKTAISAMKAVLRNQNTIMEKFKYLSEA